MAYNKKEKLNKEIQNDLIEQTESYILQAVKKMNRTRMLGANGNPLTLNEFIERLFKYLPNDQLIQAFDVRCAIACSKWASTLAYDINVWQGNNRIRSRLEAGWKRGTLQRYDGDPGLGNGRVAAFYGVAEVDGNEEESNVA